MTQCCDERGVCTQGYNCPARVTMIPKEQVGEWTIYRAPPELLQQPVYDLMDDIVFWAFNFFAALGAVSAVAIVMYGSGFFEWFVRAMK